MEHSHTSAEYIPGDLVQSTAIGLRDFEFNSFGRLGILVEIIDTREAAKVWWFGAERASTVLFSNFKLLSRTKNTFKETC
tara:strand:- start:4568 stop:4807 length:240 start_codon:yes stop_codon:yes gene_type:complete